MSATAIVAARMNAVLPTSTARLSSTEGVRCRSAVDVPCVAATVLGCDVQMTSRPIRSSGPGLRPVAAAPPRAERTGRGPDTGIDIDIDVDIHIHIDIDVSRRARRAGTQAVR